MTRGLALALVTEPVLILFVGALALVAAVLYSGGPRPYAGLGLGEVMVFLFFGLMATCGTTFVMIESVPATAWWCGAAIGFLAVAILEANNLRDIPTDEASGKRTLAVRLGDRSARRLYRATVVLAFATVVHPAKGTSRTGGQQQDVWTISADGSNRQRLTDGNGTNLMPFWGTDNRVYFISDRGGTECVWSARTDGVKTFTASAEKQNGKNAGPAKPQPEAIGSTDASPATE